MQVGNKAVVRRFIENVATGHDVDVAKGDAAFARFDGVNLPDGSERALRVPG